MHSAECATPSLFAAVELRSTGKVGKGEWLGCESATAELLIATIG